MSKLKTMCKRSSKSNTSKKKRAKQIAAAAIIAALAAGVSIPVLIRNLSVPILREKRQKLKQIKREIQTLQDIIDGKIPEIVFGTNMSCKDRQEAQKQQLHKLNIDKTLLEEEIRSWCAASPPAAGE